MFLKITFLLLNSLFETNLLRQGARGTLSPYVETAAKENRARRGGESLDETK